MFPEKRMESIFVYVLDCMLTLDKMQNISALMCNSSNNLNTAINWVFWLSDWSSIAYKLIIFRPSTTGTMLLTTQNLHTTTNWCATSQKNKQKYAKLSISSLIRIHHYAMPLNHK